MRCLACNVQLSDKEATRKYASSGEFLDLCDNCYEPIKDDVPVIESKNIKKGNDGQTFSEEDFEE